MTCWLKTNTRPLFVSMVFPVLLLVVGILLLAFMPTAGYALVFRWLAIGMLAFAGIALASLIWLLTVPRLGYRPGYLVVYSDYIAPHHVPIDIVECFFLGHGPSKMAWKDEEDGPETNTLVVRLAEAEVDWHKKSCRPALGHWCDGYIVLRGTWCEPLTGEVVGRLNEQLIEAHREQRVAREQASAVND